MAHVCPECDHPAYLWPRCLQNHRARKHGVLDVGHIDPAMRGLTPINPAQRAPSRNKNKKGNHKKHQYVKIGRGQGILDRGLDGHSEIIDLCTPSPSPSPEAAPPPASHTHHRRFSNNPTRSQWKVDNSSSRRNSSPGDSDVPTLSYLPRAPSSSRQRIRLTSDTPMPNGGNNPNPNIEHLSLSPEYNHPPETEYDELDSTPAVGTPRRPHRSNAVVVLIPNGGGSRSRRASSVATHFIDSDTPDPDRAGSVDSEEIQEEEEVVVSEEVQEEIEDVAMALARTPSPSEEEKERSRRGKRPARTSTPNPTDQQGHKDKRQRPMRPTTPAQSSSSDDGIVSPWANVGHFPRPSWGGGNSPGQDLSSASVPIPALAATPLAAASPVPPAASTGGTAIKTTGTTQQLPFPVPAPCPSGSSRVASHLTPKAASKPQQQKTENSPEYDELEPKVAHESESHEGTKTQSKTEAKTENTPATTRPAPATCSATACATCHGFAHAMHWLHTLLGRHTACDGHHVGGETEKGEK